MLGGVKGKGCLSLHEIYSGGIPEEVRVVYCTLYSIPEQVFRFQFRNSLA